MRVQTRLMILLLMLLSLSVSAMALTIDVYPLHVQNSAGDNVSVVVRVTENSTPLSNMAVNFITNLGTLNSVSTLTNASGYGQVFLRSTDSGIATLNASIGSTSNTTNITFSPLSSKSIIISESTNSMIAGNITTVRIGMLDQFGNVNDTAKVTLNVRIEDVYGNVNETQIIRTPYTLTHIKASNLTDTGNADIAITNSVTSDENITLEINSTIAGNITISASSGEVINSKNIEVLPAEPHGITLWYYKEYTVNTTSDITVCVYDMYGNPVRNSLVRFNATAPVHTIYNSPNEYNSLHLSDPNIITGIDGLAVTEFRTDKRAGTNTINITVVNTSLGSEIAVRGLADVVDNLFLTPSPAFAYANNQDTYKLIARPVDQFLNPIIPDGFPINEQVVFYSGSSSAIVTLNQEGKATMRVGPTPYVENVSINATYRNAGGYTNITNSTTLKFIPGSNLSLVIYCSPDTLLTKNLNGNHESTVKVIALDQWGHTLPGVNLTINITNSTVGYLSLNSVNATTIHTTTNDFGKATLNYWSSTVPGTTAIIVTTGNATVSAPITTKNVPFVSTNVIIEPESLNSGGIVNVTTVVSVEGDLQVTRPAANAMLVLDRSGSMDPDYYAGTPLDVVLVIDRSGSMAGTPIADAKEAAKEFVDNLVSNSKVGIVSFSTTCTVNRGMTSLNVYNNKLLVDTSISSLSASGYTAMGYGMANASSLLINNGRSESRKVMIVLTDGVTNRGSDPKDLIPVANANGITIYTIGLGDVDESLLDYIASETGGKYYYAPDSSQLRSVYNAIAQELSDYDISDVEYGVEGFTSYDYVFQDSVVNTIPINETINDLKVKLECENSSSDLHLQLTSPSGMVYGTNDNTTGYYPESDTSEYIWIQPVSYIYPDNDSDSVGLGNWTVRVTGSVSGTEHFNISTYIDKKSAAKLSSHAFISSFDESRGDKAGLALYSFAGNSLSAIQSSYILKNSNWVGYFTAHTTGRYNFNLSWDDSSNIEACLYDGTDLLDSSSGTGTCKVSSVLFAGETYYLDITKGALSYDDTHFVVNVTTLPIDTIMTAYNDNSEILKFRTWNGSQWSLEKSAKNIDTNPYFVVLESSQIRPEIVMVTGDSSNHVNVQIWNGVSWGSVRELSNNLESNAKRGFDLNYEQVSGDAVAVYMNRSISNIPQYKIWDGSSWSSASATASKITGPGKVGWVRLEANPNSDEMVLATLDSSNYIRTQVWNGNSWGSPVEITKNAKTSAYQCFDIVYEQTTGRAMLVWADSNYVKYRIWNGNSWESEHNLYSFSNSICWLKLAADPHSDNLLLVSQDTANDVYANTWTGSSWSARKLLETDAGTSARRTVDAAFEQSSGTGLVVWGDMTSTPKYETWNGVSWSNEASASNFGSGSPMWVQLTPDPLSDEIFLMTSDDSYDLNIQKWTGSSWSSATEVETSSTNSYECFGIAYNSQEASVESTPVLWTEWTAEVTSTLNNDSLAHLGNSIDTITADGLTAIDEGLFVANKELASVNGSSTIVLMTDGLDNAGYHSLLEEAYKAKENNTIIYTVGFGKSESEVDPVLLEIADITGGKYYFAPNSSVLKNIFKGIAQQITNFSAQGPVLNIQVPHNYATLLGTVDATYISGSSNSTTGDRNSFMSPKYPSRGNAEPAIITLSNRSVLSWQLPTLSPGEKWGVWYQMVVEGTGYVPLVMTGSNISYMNVAGEEVQSSVPGGGSSARGSSAGINPYPLGSFTMTASKPMTLINESSQLALEVKDITGNYTSAYVVLYTNLGSLNGQQIPVNITVDGRRTLTFSSVMAGNAYVTACAYNVNNVTDTKQCDKLLVIRPKGMIRIN
ncbi:VWA domain-containing protein [uncultured Methanomethylovorans sp.]|uniref:VWA domain-containing protein n=1 Tax=uncultured Methanomethylovorans sp. TaxID=183759 RepID=UPI002AA90F16|nr:VWA domain-containing protein [uncultured Methanomethylovorans sp.]